MANPRTIARLEARILERAAHCVEFELSDPRIGIVTLTKVELSSDLGHAKIHYSVLGTPAEQRSAQRALDAAAGFVQRQLGRVLDTRRTPHVRWIYDDSAVVASEMDRKIRDALRHDREINPAAHEELAERIAAGEDESQELEREIEDYLRDPEAREGGEPQA
ncbi:MAG TPA: 30S ribosome-binding factor RbfA [Planctomycetota bacterium]|nr:30S ribosome-binding factor RbfA [Planctomycetota bacterium]